MKFYPSFDVWLSLKCRVWSARAQPAPLCEDAGANAVAHFPQFRPSQKPELNDRRQNVRDLNWLCDFNGALQRTWNVAEIAIKAI